MIVLTVQAVQYMITCLKNKENKKLCSVMGEIIRHLLFLPSSGTSLRFHSLIATSLGLRSAFEDVMFLKLEYNVFSTGLLVEILINNGVQILNCKILWVLLQFDRVRSCILLPFVTYSRTLRC